MKLTLSEKVNITRRRLHMTQATFYKGICDQQAGSYIEKHYVKGFSPRIDKTVAELKQLYDLEPKDLTIYEIARIARQRRGEGVNDAAKKIKHSRVWVMDAEKGKKSADKLYEEYL